jgi:hypothetical protein
MGKEGGAGRAGGARVRLLNATGGTSSRVTCRARRTLAAMLVHVGVGHRE